VQGSSVSRRPVIEDGGTNIHSECFVDALICIIPLLTGSQTFSGGISPYEAKLRLMWIAKNIDV